MTIIDYCNLVYSRKIIAINICIFFTIIKHMNQNNYMMHVVMCKKNTLHIRTENFKTQTHFRHMTHVCRCSLSSGGYSFVYILCGVGVPSTNENAKNAY